VFLGRGEQEVVIFKPRKITARIVDLKFTARRLRKRATA
jgi:hypothetical protein